MWTVLASSPITSAPIPCLSSVAPGRLDLTGLMPSLASCLPPSTLPSHRRSQNGMPPPKPPPEEQILPLNNERFMVPETVFRPSDIGMTQAGITEACLQVKLCAAATCRHARASAEDPSDADTVARLV